MTEPEAIKASDLVKLMEVVKAATGLYNELEKDIVPLHLDVEPEFIALGNALRALGLIEVQP